MNIDKDGIIAILIISIIILQVTNYFQDKKLKKEIEFHKKEKTEYNEECARRFYEQENVIILMQQYYNTKNKVLIDSMFNEIKSWRGFKDKSTDDNAYFVLERFPK